MNRSVFFAHSGGMQGGPGQGSYDFVRWLRKELGEEYKLHDPIIEEPDAPTYEVWKAMFDRELSGLTEKVFLIGHSLGGSVLLKYLSEERCSLQITGLFLVATPFWGAQGWTVDEFTLRTDFSKYLPTMPAIHLYHCLDDPVVPSSHLEVYRNVIPDAFTHELPCGDHSFSDGLPMLADHIKSIK